MVSSHLPIQLFKGVCGAGETKRSPGMRGQCSWSRWAAVEVGKVGRLWSAGVADGLVYNLDSVDFKRPKQQKAWSCRLLDREDRLGEEESRVQFGKRRPEVSGRHLNGAVKRTLMGE